ncbi:MAG: hypothetical protein GX446_05475 [Chthonomonadales bacterium]|nr:hypothetical protein [Chthonomonadales bacterium]
MRVIMTLAAAWAAVSLWCTPSKGDVKVEKVAYFGQPNCYKLTNGTVEVIVTTDIGPRVIRYGFVGKANVFAELPDDVVQTEWGAWKPYGGHRFWHAPEVKPRSYAPDNDKVAFEMVGTDGIRLTQAVEQHTGMQKEMVVTLDPVGTGVKVAHRLTNKGVWSVEAAAWALTIVAGGGTTIIPQEPYISHDDYVLPARPMVLWHYNDFTDPRWTIGKKYIRLRTEETMNFAQKVGVANKQGWMAYLNGGTLFVKRFPYMPGAKYPDEGCNCETFTKGTFMEVETVGPLMTIQPGDTIEHVERWFLFGDVKPGTTEATLDAAIAPLVAKTSLGDL